MSDISDSCRVAVVLADFASQDGGKVGALGAGWFHTGSPTPPQAVIAIIEVPGEHANVPFAFSIVLEDERGNPHQVDNQLGEPQPLRVAQNLIAPSIPGFPRRCPVAVNFVINIAPGMPLTPDHVYTWRVSIDGESHPQWATSFYVRHEDAPPVIG